MSHLREADQGPRGVERRPGSASALLVEAPRGHDGGSIPVNEARECAPDLGDIVVLLLAGTLAGLRDRLTSDGFVRAAELVGDLVEITDHYLTEVHPEATTRPRRSNS